MAEFFAAGEPARGASDRACYYPAELQLHQWRIADTMKAYAISQYGEADYFSEIELPKPALRDGHVLIRVAASSVNPVDTKIRAGGRAMCPDLPAVLHMDVSGTVEAVGPGVTAFQPGDQVYGCAGGLKTIAGEDLPGALADYMLADADLIAMKPASLSLEQAAALPLVTITAWEGLLQRADIRAGDKVLVHGGTGGVGHIGVQLAKHAGAEVYCTVSSEEKARIARDLGADVTIDYNRYRVQDYVERFTAGCGFDLVFDTVGGVNLEHSIEAARVNGCVVSILTAGEHELSGLHAKGLTLHTVFMLIPMLYGQGRDKHGEILRAAADLVDRGELRPLIDPSHFSFAQAADAHRKLAAGKVLGKLVLTHR